MSIHYSRDAPPLPPHPTALLTYCRPSKLRFYPPYPGMHVTHLSALSLTRAVNLKARARARAAVVLPGYSCSWILVGHKQNFGLPARSREIPPFFARFELEIRSDSMLCHGSFSTALATVILSLQ